jgi:hypothetical protein
VSIPHYSYFSSLTLTPSLTQTLFCLFWSFGKDNPKSLICLKRYFLVKALPSLRTWGTHFCCCLLRICFSFGNCSSPIFLYDFHQYPHVFTWPFFLTIFIGPMNSDTWIKMSQKSSALGSFGYRSKHVNLFPESEIIKYKMCISHYNF